MEPAIVDPHSGVTPRVTVVIPTFNRARYLTRALAALGRQTVADGTFDVIVIDDGSTDDTADVLAQPQPFPLQVLSQPNQGPAVARNAGIEQATGEIILFVDDDVIPADDLIELHLGAHAEAGRVVIGRMLPPGGRQPFWAEWEMRMLERQYDDMREGRFQACPRQFYTANASVRRADLVRAGLFDGRYRRAEDVELGYRLEDLGLRFVFQSDACVLHDTPRTLDGWITMAQQYGYYDVMMWREANIDWILEMIRQDFNRSRRASLRIIARWTVGRRRRMAVVRAVAPHLMCVAGRLGMRRVAVAGCSALFNLLYWDAFCIEFGGREAFWDVLDEPAPGTMTRPAAVE